MGDINLSNGNGANTFSARSGLGKIPLEITSSAEEDFHLLRFRIKNSEQVIGFQLFLNFGDLEILSLHFPEMISPESYQIKENSVRMSWTNPAYALATDSEIMIVRISRNINLDVKDELTLYSQLGPSEVYLDDLTEKEVILQWKNETGSAVNHKLSIYPNPFFSHSIILFDIVSPSEVDVQIFDFAGKTVYEQSEFMDEGYHNVEITNQDIINEGIYLCKVRIGSQFFNRKIVFSR